ncbi:14-3-3 protein 1-like [Coffea eugenioides]|uniref:14-3-3 protein 1-like n=1 Tax=Coffea eugenioides TaxID=49369 RepID=UPI000F60D77B|nr:14-3-3 protein 1-like [Coffea eugenioides]XP_027166218.1 14-3-3 protein 1-like [Coffea eugenioides]
MADSQNSSTREQCLYMAKVAELAERYNEMMNYMNKLVRASVYPTSELTSEERRLLSTAYYRVISMHRSAWRKMRSLEQNNDGNTNDDLVLVQEYRARIEADISEICDGILKLLDETLIPSASSSESKVFYFITKGDHERYLAEIKGDDERREAAEKAMQSYQTAEQIALADLPPKHPRRLGVALNFAVFHSEILKACESGCSKARLAYAAAHSDETQLPEELQEESAAIMQRLRNNITFWDAQRTLEDYAVHI